LDKHGQHGLLVYTVLFFFKKKNPKKNFAANATKLASAQEVPKAGSAGVLLRENGFGVEGLGLRVEGCRLYLNENARPDQEVEV